MTLFTLWFISTLIPDRPDLRQQSKTSLKFQTFVNLKHLGNTEYVQDCRIFGQCKLFRVCEIFGPRGIFGECWPQIARGKTWFLCQLQTMLGAGSVTNLTLPLHDETAEEEILWWMRMCNEHCGWIIIEILESKSVINVL